jgi:hypothetical protein
MMSQISNVNVPIEYEVAAEPVLQVNDRVRDKPTGQVGVVVGISPAGFIEVNWLVWMCGEWHRTHQFSLCSRSDLEALA